MSDGAPPAEKGSTPRLSRKLSFLSRVRAIVRAGSDRILGADLAWSVGFGVVCLALLASQRCALSYEVYEVGDVASADVLAHTDIEVIDASLTEPRRQKARDRVAEVYAQGGLQQIADYCQADVEATGALYKRVKDYF